LGTEPAGAPVCWGKQFGDEDDECRNCNFNISCRPATLNYRSAVDSRRSGAVLPQPSPHSLPMYQPTFTPPRFGPPMVQQAQTIPQPSVGYPRPGVTHVSQPTVPVSYQPHAPQGWNIPIAYLPRPNSGTPAWWQYQGESTGARLGKNLLLSALQALFAELLRFVSNWTWPTGLSTT
jgi:hypothetical protein